MIYEYFQKYQKERNIFLPLSEIRERAAGKIDQYCSIFGYEPEDVANGNIFGPMYFDIDNPDIQKAYKDAQSLIETLRFYGLTDQDFQICFSGSKGFHVAILPVVMGVKPRPDLDKIYRKIAQWFSAQLTYKGIDPRVYERRRLWRVINSINSKSGLYKVQITGQESLDEILEKAKTPHLTMQKFPSLNDAVREWIPRASEEIKAEIEENTKRRKPKTTFHYDDPINPTVRSLIESGVDETNPGRNNTAFYIACYLRSKALSESEIEGHLQVFAENCRPPLEEHEVQSVIKSANRY